MNKRNKNNKKLIKGVRIKSKERNKKKKYNI